MLFRSKLLAAHRSVRNIHDLPPLTNKQILAWADAHKAATDDWPLRDSGRVIGTDETWVGINSALKAGNRGLPVGSSLAKLLAAHRDVRNHMELAPLNIEQILVWADAHQAATNTWPNQYSEQVTGTDDTWGGINAALYRGKRGLPAGSSLAKLLSEHRSVRE